MPIKLYSDGTNYPIKFSTFPGGEEFVEIQQSLTFRQSMPVVFAQITASSEFMRLVLLLDALKRLSPSMRPAVWLPYFPYARQDRVMGPGQSLSVAVVAGILNSFELSCVVAVDPHSSVTPAVLNNYNALKSAEIYDDFLHFVWDCVREAGGAYQEAAVVAPDAGAAKRAGLAADCWGLGDVIVASKARTATGVQVAVPDTVPPFCVVVDDICDGGATFLDLGQRLRERGVKTLYLVVTHGIFSGTSARNAELNTLFDVIITSDSLPLREPCTIRLSRIECLELAACGYSTNKGALLL